MLKVVEKPSDGPQPMTLDIDALRSANMTQTQLLMWTAQKLSGRRPIYNMGMSIKIADDLDPQRFRESFDHIVRKSDAMRSVFRFVDGGVRRLVVDADELEFDMPVIDFSDRPEEADEWMDNRIRERIVLRKRAFDSALLRVGAEEFIWFICLHHLICDGMTFSNLVSHVGDQYSRLESGDHTDVEMPQYGDFVDRMLDYYASDEAAASGKYWDSLAQYPLPDLSFYGRRLEDGKTDFGRVHRALEPPFVGRMKEAIANKTFRAFSADQGLFLLMASALVLQLRRATGNDRFGIGVPLHNRLTKEEKVTLGSFFICSAMRVDYVPEESFRDLYKRVAKAYSSMLRHFRHPVATTPGERSWDVTINFVNKTFPDFAGRPVDVTWLQSGTYLSKAFVGIQIQKFNKGDGLVAEWDFNNGIFGTPEREETAMSDFEQAIEFGLNNPDAPIRDFG